MSLSSVLVVINPISGNNDKTAWVNECEQKADELHLTKFLKYKTTGENDSKSIQDLLDKHHFDRIISIGGDGTVKLIAKLILNTNTCLGILPAGSANGLAASIGLPQNINEAVSIAFGESTFMMDAICINDHYCFHLSDTGFNAEIIHRYDEMASRGFWGYSKSFIQSISTYEKGPKVNITTDNDKVSLEPDMVVIGNAQKYGFGGVINPKGIINDGQFEIVAIKNIALPEMVKMVSGAEATAYPEDKVMMIQTTSANLSYEKPVHFQIDGEYLGKIDQVSAKILPRALCVAHLPNPETVIE